MPHNKLSNDAQAHKNGHNSFSAVGTESPKRPSPERRGGGGGGGGGILYAKHSSYICTTTIKDTTIRFMSIVENETYHCLRLRPLWGIEIRTNTKEWDTW